MDNETFLTVSVAVASVGSLAAAVSAIFSAINTKTTLNLYKKEKKEKLIEEMNKLLGISIEYPYVESKPFTSKWIEHKNSNDEKYLRYDMYCNLLFNYLHHVCDFYKYDKKEIETFVDIKSWVRLHRQNWESPVEEDENVDGYDEQFRNFIYSYLK
jgi:hypothetical protein